MVIRRSSQWKHRSSQRCNACLSPLASEWLLPPHRPGRLRSRAEAAGTGPAAGQRAVPALSGTWGAFLRAAPWGLHLRAPAEIRAFSPVVRWDASSLRGRPSVGLPGPPLRRLVLPSDGQGWSVRSAPSCSEPKGGSQGSPLCSAKPSTPRLPFIQHLMLIPMSPKSRRTYV